MGRLVWAIADRIPHCWKSHVVAQIVGIQQNFTFFPEKMEKMLILLGKISEALLNDSKQLTHGKLTQTAYEALK